MRTGSRVVPAPLPTYSWAPSTTKLSSSVLRMTHKAQLDCGTEEGCGTDAPAARFDLQVKPKDPPTFAGKPTDDVEVWVQQVDNFLSLIGGPDHMQVAYVANLLNGSAQLWFQRECKGGNRPANWDCFSHMLIERFGNITKKEFAQSSLMSIRQGKNESAHDFAMRFEAVLDKVPQYDQTWVKNIFIWGLHPTLATTISLKSPATLSKAIELAKRVDSSILISRRPGNSSNVDKQSSGGKNEGGRNFGGSNQWKKKTQWKNQSTWKNQSWKPRVFGGSSQFGQQQQRTNFQPQVTQPTSSPNNVFNARGRSGGPGHRKAGFGNQRRQQMAVITQSDQVMAGQSGQESSQQMDARGTAASRSQSSGN